MGLIRKTMSVGSLGMIDYRSDKERIARSTRLNKQATRKNNKLIAQQNALIARQVAMQAAMYAPVSAPGWYDDGNQQLRWWDGVRWGDVAPTTSSAAPAGWYEDPDDALQRRYWDGSAWTEHRHDPYAK